MAITDTQKVDYLFKKVGFGATKTDVNSVKGATNEAIASPLLIRGDKIWSQAGSIPSTKPGSSSGVVTIYTNLETTEDTTATANRTWKTGHTDWIPPEFGSTYQLVVYADTTGASDPTSTGTQLFAAGSGNNDEWFFDYQSGVLHFIGTNLPSAMNGSNVIFVTGAKYTGAIGSSRADNIDNAVNNDLDSAGTGQIVDTFQASEFRTCKYIVQLEHDSDSKYHSTEILLTHNGTNVFLTEYAEVKTDSSLGTFDASIVSGDVKFTLSPAYTNTSIKAKRISVDA